MRPTVLAGAEVTIRVVSPCPIPCWFPGSAALAVTPPAAGQLWEPAATNCNPEGTSMSRSAPVACGAVLWFPTHTVTLASGRCVGAVGGCAGFHVAWSLRA